MVAIIAHPIGRRFRPLPTLNALSLSDLTATVGEAFSATVIGSAAGSTLTLTENVGGKYSLAGVTLTGSGLTAGTDAPAITETPLDPLYEPRETVFGVVVSAAPVTGTSGQPVGLLLILTKAA
jgi:hypothetical protein